jgi:hypothetical protein
MKTPVLTQRNVKAAELTLVNTREGSNDRKLYVGGSTGDDRYQSGSRNTPVVDLSVSPLVGIDPTGTVTEAYTELGASSMGKRRRKKAEKLIQKAISIWNQLQREFPNMADELLREAHSRTSSKDVPTEKRNRN